MKEAQKGFTLIELLVVIAIVALLSSVVLASLSTARKKARDAERIAGVNQLRKALELFFDDKGRYPISSSCSPTIPGGGWCSSVQTLSNGHWIHDGANVSPLTSYIATEIVDPIQDIGKWLPVNGGTIYYFATDYPAITGAGKWYMIVFGLESYPNEIEKIDGVKACDGSNFHYGNGSNGIITIGSNCVY